MSSPNEENPPIVIGSIHIHRILTHEGDLKIVYNVDGDVPLDSGLGMLSYTEFMILAGNVGVLPT